MDIILFFCGTHTTFCLSIPDRFSMYLLYSQSALNLLCFFFLCPVWQLKYTYNSGNNNKIQEGIVVLVSNLGSKGIIFHANNKWKSAETTSNQYTRYLLVCYNFLHSDTHTHIENSCARIENQIEKTENCLNPQKKTKYTRSNDVFACQCLPHTT